MISTGIVRKIDELGRIVLPKELRKNLNINPGDDFQITVDDKKIILEKFSILDNIEDKIINIIDCFSSVKNYRIFITINNKFINENDLVLQEIYEKVQERKIIIDESSTGIKISDSIILNEKYVIFPIVINSDLLGCIIISGNDKTSELISTSKIISGLIKCYLLNN